MLDASITPGNAARTDSGFTIAVAGPGGGAASLATTGNTSRDGAGGFGVGSDLARVGGQIAHDPASGQSESLSVTFDTAQTAISVEVANLFANEGGKTEVGAYTLLDNEGNEVGSGTFAAESGTTATVGIDPSGDQTFSKVVFTAAPYAEGQDGDSDDSSDYWINEIRFAAGPEDGADETDDNTGGGDGDSEDGEEDGEEDGDSDGDDDGDDDGNQDDGGESGEREHRTVLIDFEGLADTDEGDALDDQYQASHGVAFQALGGVDRGQPTLVETGGAQGAEAAFVPTDTVTDGTDIGEAFLTGSDALRDSGSTAGFRMNIFDGAWRVAGDLLDLDGGETWTITGQNAAGEAVASLTLSDETDNEGGDGAATPWELAVDSADDAITTVVFQGGRADGRNIGFGVDNIEIDVDARPDGEGGNDGGSGSGDEGTGEDDSSGDGGTGDSGGREHRTLVIDFENLADTAEGDAIDDQYQASDGVTFQALDGVARGEPILAETGLVDGDFAGFGPGDDTTDGSAIGGAFLTTRTTDSGDFDGPAGFRMTIADGAWRVAGDLLDLDRGESWTLVARDASGNVVDETTLTDETGEGDAAATPWELTADSADSAIATVTFEGERNAQPETIGFGFDNFEIDVAADPGDSGDDQGNGSGDDGAGNDGAGSGGDGDGNPGVDVDISLVQDFGEDGGYIAKAVITNTGDSRFFDWEAAVDLGDSGAFVTGWSSDINAPITVDGAGGDTGEFGTSDTFRRPIDPGDSFTLHYQSDGGTVEDDSFDFDVLTPESGGTANADDLEAELTIDDWGNGFIANLVVNNTSGGPISDWTVEIDFGDSDVNLTDVWGATAGGSGSTVTLTAADFNAAIPEDGRVFAGFVAEDNSVDALQTVVEADSIAFL